MPRVPTVVSPQAEASPLRAPDTRSIVSPELMGEEGRQQAELGKGLMTAGVGLGAVAYQIKQKTDAMRVFEAETALKDEYLAYEAEVRKSRNGGLASGLTKDTSKWWDENVRKRSEALENDDQRRMFVMRAAPVRQSSLNAVSGFEAEQTTKHAIQSQQASTNLSWRAAGTNPSPENLGIARRLVEEETAVLTSTNGWSKAQSDEHRLKRLTEGHAAVFDNIVGRDYTQAKNYFEANKKEIDPLRYDAFEKKLKQGGMDTLAQNFADAATGAGLTLTQAIEKARKELSGPEEEAVVKHLHTRYAEVNTAVVADFSRAVMAGKPWAQIQAMPGFDRVDADTQLRLRDAYERRQVNTEQLAAARESRAYTRERRAEQQQHKDALPTVLALQDPANLARLTRPAVEALLPVVGEQSTRDLLQRWDHIKASAENFREAKIEKDDFNMIADSRGFKVFEKPSDLSDEQKRDINNLHSAVTERIQQEQIARGNKKLTDQEKREVMTQVIDNHVMQRVWVGSNRKVPFALMDEERRQSAYIEENGQRFYLKSIPKDEWEKTVAAMRRANVPLTPVKAVEVWRAAKARAGK